MEGSGSGSDPPPEWNPPPTDISLGDSMWQLRLDVGDSAAYPERLDEPDCAYYVRTGFCGYGARCRYNHPRDSAVISGAVRSGGGHYPERAGQLVCQYYMKTGSCKFGATCKYHHPKYGVGSTSSVSLNYYGYPLRPGEKECSYYVKTGHCKFGLSCKFHHPQPSGISMPTTPAPAFYPTVQPPSVPSPPVTGWQVARRPLLPGSYIQGPYGPMVFSPGLVQIPGWSPYLNPPLSPVPSPGSQHAVSAGSPYGLTHQLSPLAPAYSGSYSSLSSGAGPSSSSQKEHMFPERPGQPECQFYMRNGFCNYGSACKYHHPSEWSMPKTTCILSPMGLPLRLGAPTCTFYAQHGLCKFGSTCKFDHPMGTLSYSPSASSLVDMPVAPYPVGSSMGTLAPSSSSSELRPDSMTVLNREAFSARIRSSENTSSGSVGSIYSKGGAHVPQVQTQLPSQGSAPPSGGSGTGHVSTSSNSS